MLESGQERKNFKSDESGHLKTEITKSQIGPAMHEGFDILPLLARGVDATSRKYREASAEGADGVVVQLS